MDPTSMYTGGIIVSLIIWFGFAFILTDDTVKWQPLDYKAFAVGVLGCFVWFITIPLITKFILYKRKG